MVFSFQFLSSQQMFCSYLLCVSYILALLACFSLVSLFTVIILFFICLMSGHFVGGVGGQKGGRSGNVVDGCDGGGGSSRVCVCVGLYLCLSVYLPLC